MLPSAFTKTFNSATELADKFYAKIGWSRQTDRIRQSDIGSIIHWNLAEGFSIEVIEKALDKIAEMPDTKSLKRAEYYLAPMTFTGSENKGEEVETRKYSESIEREKDDRIELLKKIQEGLSEKEYEKKFQDTFDDIQAENPEYPPFLLETLARQTLNQKLIREYKSDNSN